MNLEYHLSNNKAKTIYRYAISCTAFESVIYLLHIQIEKCTRYIYVCKFGISEHHK